ncbi:MAG: hypothetical protein AAF581_02960 [Planctomycetota bacterium]
MQRRSWTIGALLGCFLLVGAPPATAQINPRGMYYMQNTQGGNPTTFTEWFSVLHVSGNQYELRDFFGFGWNGTIGPGGAILISGQFPGSFTGPDAFSTQVGNGAGYLYNCTRCPGTTVNFPTQLPSAAIPGDVARSGDYDAVTQGLNPQSGAVNATFNETVTLTITGNKLRLARPNGIFFEGLFFANDHVGIRVINNTVTGWLPSYATYAGTVTNHPRDTVGEVIFHDADNFTATICLQTRAAIGSQQQSLLKIVGTRGGDFLPGDFDTDGAVGLSDAVSLLDYLFGVTQQVLPCDSASANEGNNLMLLDANGDNSVDLVDAVHLIAWSFSAGPPHVLGMNCQPTSGCAPVCP